MSGNDTHLPYFEFTAPSGRFAQNDLAFVRVRLMSQKGETLYAQQVDCHGVDIPSAVLAVEQLSTVTIAEARQIALGRNRQ